MTVQARTLQLQTKGNADVQNITGKIAKEVSDTGQMHGIVTVFTPSSTSSITTIEYEPGAVNDLLRLFDEIINPDRDYAHHARWGDGNGHSHVRAALLGPSITIPFIKQQLCLGTWQQVIFIDFDVRPRRREVVLQIIGE